MSICYVFEYVPAIFWRRILSRCLIVCIFLMGTVCGSNLSRYIRSPATKCQDIKFIVDYHNNVRRQLANGTKPGEPKAANMQKMVWDTTLSKIATAYSKKMIPIHNPKLYDKRYVIGENIFMTSSTNLKNLNVEWIRALNGWYGESELYTYQLTKRNNITGHYQQMIWWDTIHIGCGTTQFLYNNRSIRKIYICNYGPTGNWDDTFPYQVDNVIEEFETLISEGIIPPDAERPQTLCDNLCCNFSQCALPYGPKCKFTD